LLEHFWMTDEQWETWQVPVGIVGIVYRAESSHPVAYYPGPAGLTEARFELEDWSMLLDSNPSLREIEPDVEVLLINHMDSAYEHYIVPLDLCYQLAGRLRLSWKGFSGGQEAHQALAEFFAELRKRASIVGAETSVECQRKRHELEGEH
jgi:hypothetical protein